MTADQPQSPPPNPPRPGARDTLHAELPCRRCGYLLTGLSIRGNCPECGLPVAFSYQGEYLKHSNPRWLGVLALGTVLIFAGLVATIFLLPLHYAALAIFAGRRFGGLLNVLMSLAFPATQFVALAGNLLLTRREPVRFSQERFRLPLVTRLVRAADVLCILFLWLWPLVHFIGASDLLRIVLIFLAVGGWAAAQVLEIAVLRRLLRRIPNYALVRWADVLVHGLAILYSLCFGIYVVANAVLWTDPANTHELANALGCALSIFAFSAAVFQLMGLPFLLQAARALLRERRLAFPPPLLPT